MSLKHRSAEEQEISKIFSDADALIKDYEQRIKDLPNDQGPGLHPGGGGNMRPLGAKARMIADIQEKIGGVRAEAADKAAKVLAQAKPDVQARGKFWIDTWLDPARPDAPQKKDIDSAQRFAAKTLYDHQMQPEPEILSASAGADHKDLDNSQSYAAKLLKDHKAQSKEGIKDLDASQSFASKVLAEHRPQHKQPESKVTRSRDQGPGKASAQKDQEKKNEPGFSLDKPYKLNLSYTPMKDSNRESREQGTRASAEKENKESAKPQKEAAVFSMEASYSLTLPYTPPHEVAASVTFGKEDTSSDRRPAEEREPDMDIDPDKD